MNSILELLNDFSGPWTEWIWRATWQVAIVIAVAWALTVVLARQSPRFRSWIWRLAYVKLLVLLMWTTPLRLAVLPADEITDATKPQPPVALQDSAVKPQPPVALTNAERAKSEEAVASYESRAIHEELLSAAAVRPPLAHSDPPTEVRSPSVASQPATPFVWFFLAWLIGLAAVFAWMAAGVLRSVKLWRSARPINRPDLDRLLQDVRRDLKLRPQAQLAQSNLAAGPMLLKFLAPRIIFPTEMVDQLSPDEIRLVLSHEMAHIKRRDLAWNALAAPVHLALYFHPLVWFAHRLSRR